MAACTYGIGAAPRETKQRGEKSLQATSLWYSIAKYTLQVLLTLTKSRKPNLKVLILFIFLLRSSSSPSSISKTLYGVCKY